MERAISETDREREKQVAYNESNGITPTTIKRNIAEVVAHVASGDYVTPEIDEETSNLVGHNQRAYIEDLEKRMRKAAGDLEFEEAARLRDERSEEHTSELQSLMRISYAVFCLKKKQNYTNNKSYTKIISAHQQT